MLMGKGTGRGISIVQLIYWVQMSVQTSSLGGICVIV